MTEHADSALQTLIDKDAVSQVVLQYARAVDAHDWPLYAACFTPTFYRDFSSFAPNVRGEATNVGFAEEVSRTLTGFDATQHNSTNHHHEINGDTATCRSYMTAEHIFIEDGVSDSITLGGGYTNQLIRTSVGWKINHCTIHIRWSRGNMALFEKAIQRAAERNLHWTAPA
ncbi:MAG: nuclear transport factor 2 family protein [Pseudomonadota bacterium]